MTVKTIERTENFEGDGQGAAQYSMYSEYHPTHSAKTFAIDYCTSRNIRLEFNFVFFVQRAVGLN